MLTGKCRVCGNSFFDRPLLCYEDMPKAAQFLPDRKSFRSDKGVALKICQCSGCGLVQLDSKPVPYYKEVIRAAGFSQEMKRFRKKQFAGLVKKYSLKNKKIIEIGCGLGEYLSIMRQARADTYGLESSAESVRQCVKHGLKVEKGFMESSVRLKEAPFDAFFMLSFLEHLPEPNSALRGIYNNLKDDAIGLVEVPNFDMILKKNLFSEFIADHLLYFTEETLSLTLSLNGFEVIEAKQIWHDYIISAIVRKRKKMDLGVFRKQRIRLKDDIIGYLRRFPAKQVAIWGAGHQALTLISLLNLGGKIKYVVDSAPFKQGKYTPATHLPIVSPEALIKEPVDAVIVMAASYSDEVAAILRKKFGAKMRIGILRDFGLEDA